MNLSLRGPHRGHAPDHRYKRSATWLCCHLCLAGEFIHSHSQSPLQRDADSPTL
jgi:hypothetical protein